MNGFRLRKSVKSVSQFCNLKKTLIQGPDNRHYALLAILVILGSAVAMLKFSFAVRPSLSRRDKKMFEAKAKYVRESVLPKKERLYMEYLTDSVGEI